MLRNDYPWILFCGVLLLLVFSSSSYSKAIDSILWPVRFGILAGVSILFVWSWWRHRKDASGRPSSAASDSADHFLTSLRRWYYSDQRIEIDRRFRTLFQIGLVFS